MSIFSLDDMSNKIGHVIVDDSYYEKLEEPSDEENDMLDLAFGLTDT